MASSGSSPSSLETNSKVFPRALGFLDPVASVGVGVGGGVGAGVELTNKLIPSTNVPNLYSCEL